MTNAENTNPLENMIDFAANAEFNKANDVFDNILTQKVHHALEQQKVAVAQEIWSDAAEETDDASDISDEDLEAAAEDVVGQEDFEVED